MVNGDLVNGHLREIFPVFPADDRRYSRWLPLIKQIISKLIFTSVVICGKSFLFFPSMVNGESSVILLFLKHNANPTSTLSVINYQLPIHYWQLTIHQIISYPLLVKYPKCLYQAVLVSFFNTAFSTCISFKMAMQASFNGNSSNFAIWKTTSESIPL